MRASRADPALDFADRVHRLCKRIAGYGLRSEPLIEKMIAAQYAVEFRAPETDTVKALFQRSKEEGNLFSELLEDYQ